MLWGITYTSQMGTFRRLKFWVSSSKNGRLGYMSGKRMRMRADLRYYFPQFQQALVGAFPYPRFDQSDRMGKIAHYALGFGGQDYHLVVGKILEELSQKIKAVYPECLVKIALDVHPVADRDLAYRAGLGWFGKNSMLINRRFGPHFMIGSLLLSQVIPKGVLKGFLPASSSFATSDEVPGPISLDHCGSCQLCVAACPTQAIDPFMRAVDARLCLSTYTIEIFDDEVMAPPPILKFPGHIDREIFGCDLCLDICPWGHHKNDPPLFLNTDELGPWGELLQFKTIQGISEYLERFSNRSFRKKFRGTALERLGKLGFLKNLRRLGGR